MDISLKNQLLAKVSQLSAKDQQRVLDFAKYLSKLQALDLVFCKNVFARQNKTPNHLSEVILKSRWKSWGATRRDRPRNSTVVTAPMQHQENIVKQGLSAPGDISDGRPTVKMRSENR